MLTRGREPVDKSSTKRAKYLGEKYQSCCKRCITAKETRVLLALLLSNVLFNIQVLSKTGIKTNDHKCAYHPSPLL